MYPVKKLFYLYFLAGLCLGGIIQPKVSAATSVSQYGITWNFDGEYEVGKFISGDYWVLEKTPGGGVTITSIIPESAEENGRTTHGSMSNPEVGTSPPQGFDSSLGGYREELNIALQLPKNVKAQSSIVSVISHPKPSNRPGLTDAAVLTVLSSKPNAGDYRPPYVGDDKSLRWNHEKVDMDQLKRLPRPPSAPSLESLKQRVERPYIEIHTSVGGREWHPLNNQEFYGREIAYDLSKCLLSLHLDYTNEEKNELLISMLQLGIDIYGAAKEDGYWQDKGGHNHGRKMTMLLAGVMFNDPDILTYADAEKHMIFQEDLQTFFVTQNDIDNCPKYSKDGRRRDCYTQEMLGMPEWGAQHTSQSIRDGSNWNAKYRTTVGNSLIGHILTARMMNVEAYWNHDAVFEYMDRLWLKEKDKAANKRNKLHLFERDMWKRYRGDVE